MQVMSESKPIPVRLSDDVLERLEKAAEKIGVETRAAVIKLCLTSFLDYYEKHGYEDLKPAWEKIRKEMDGRYSARDPEILKAAVPKGEYTSSRRKR